MPLTGTEIIVALLRRSDAIRSIVGDRVNSEEVSQRDRLPFLTVQKVDAVHEQTITTSAGVVHERIQVDYYSPRNSQVSDLADAGRLALDLGKRGNVTVEGVTVDVRSIKLENDQSEFTRTEAGADSVQKRVTHDYKFWYVETVPTF